MAAFELKDRRESLFGRAGDINVLRQRAGTTGITVVAGPPQVGKSWLLMEAARQSDQLPAADRPVVGYSRSPKGAPDPMLQVVADLYTRWLDDASALQEAQAVYGQQKDRALTAFARFMAKLAEKAAEAVPVLGKMGGTAIREAVEGLVVASEDLRSGRLAVSKLEYPQARELVSSVMEISKRKAALFLDQWDETSDQARQMDLFRNVLRERENWTGCHIFLGVREGGEGEALYRDLRSEFPTSVRIHTLGDISLDGQEERHLSDFLRARVTAFWNLTDEAVVEQSGRNAVVIGRLTDPDASEAVRTTEGVTQLIAEAWTYQYRELEALLEGLSADERRWTVRLALVPLAEDVPSWTALKQVLSQGLSLTLLDDLMAATVLTRSNPPSFGHSKRREVAEATLRAKRFHLIVQETKDLIRTLANDIRGTEEGVRPHVVSIIRLHQLAPHTELDPVEVALCASAQTLFGDVVMARQSIPLGSGMKVLALDPRGHVLLAMGLFNTLIDAQTEGDLARRDALLAELRGLAEAHPADAAIREPLANAYSIRSAT